MTSIFSPKVHGWAYFVYFWFIESAFLALSLSITAVQRFAWRLLIACIVIVIRKFLVVVFLNVDHSLIFSSISLAWLCYILSPREVGNFETSGALAFSCTQLLKSSWPMYWRIVRLEMWIGTWNLNNYTVLFLNFTLDTNPIILHNNMNMLERWPDFYPFSVLSNIMSNLSFPFIFFVLLYLETYHVFVECHN